MTRDSGGQPTWVCRHCDDAFLREAHHDLHLGRVHSDLLTAGESKAFAGALAEEDAWIARFQCHVRGGMATLPIVLVYMLVVLIAAVGDANLLWSFLLLPGALAFGTLVYAVEYGRKAATLPPADTPVD